MDIRKISVGPDYKSGAMHYLVGQSVLNGSYSIHLIKFEEVKKSFLIYIENDEGIMLWKEFTSTMPVSIEYNINFLQMTDNERAAFENQVADLESKMSKTEDFGEKIELADQVHNIKMKLNGVKPTDSHIYCIGCGS